MRDRACSLRTCPKGSSIPRQLLLFFITSDNKINQAKMATKRKRDDDALDDDHITLRVKLPRTTVVKVLQRRPTAAVKASAQKAFMDAARAVPRNDLLDRLLLLLAQPSPRPRQAGKARKHTLLILRILKIRLDELRKHLLAAIDGLQDAPELRGAQPADEGGHVRRAVGRQQVLDAELAVLADGRGGRRAEPLERAIEQAARQDQLAWVLGQAARDEHVEVNELRGREVALPHHVEHDLDDVLACHLEAGGMAVGGSRGESAAIADWHSSDG